MEMKKQTNKQKCKSYSIFFRKFTCICLVFEPGNCRNALPLPEMHDLQ